MFTIKSFAFKVRLICTVSFFAFCRPAVPTKPANAGLVTVNAFFYDTIQQKFVYSPTDWPENKIWYKDSCTIQQLTGINLEQDKDGRFRRKVLINGYLFINLRTKSFYEYSSFSDTAQVKRQYTQPDSVDIDGGWNFYNQKDIGSNIYTALSDTTMDGIEYRRYQFNKMWGNKDHSTIGYLRCDRTGSLFEFGQATGQKLGCPIVRLDDFIVKPGQNRSSARIDFLRDNLTAEELKVFAAWEKNARKNPVR